MGSVGLRLLMVRETEQDRTSGEHLDLFIPNSSACKARGVEKQSTGVMLGPFKDVFSQFPPLCCFLPRTLSTKSPLMTLSPRSGSRWCQHPAMFDHTTHHAHAYTHTPPLVKLNFFSLYEGGRQGCVHDTRNRRAENCRI